MEEGGEDLGKWTVLGWTVGCIGSLFLWGAFAVAVYAIAYTFLIH